MIMFNSTPIYNGMQTLMKKCVKKYKTNPRLSVWIGRGCGIREVQTGAYAIIVTVISSYTVPVTIDVAVRVIVPASWAASTVSNPAGETDVPP